MAKEKTEETSALVKFTDKYPALSGASAAQLREVIAENLGEDAQLQQWDLERLKLPSGGMMQWMEQDDSGNMEPAGKEVEGIIVLAKRGRSYWEKGADQEDSTPSNGVPPDCSSPDGIMGIGKPGGECATCPLSHFGRWSSAGEWIPRLDSKRNDDDQPPPCKALRHVFLLREGKIFPTLIVLPPTSAGVLYQWLKKQSMRVKPYWNFVVRMGLVPAENANKIKYAKLVVNTVRPLTPEELAVVEPQVQLMKATFGNYHEGAATAGQAVADDADMDQNADLDMGQPVG